MLRGHGNRVNVNEVADLGLPHRDFVDERVPLDGYHDVGGLHRALGGVVDAGHGQHGPAGPDAEPFRFGRQCRAGGYRLLGAGDLLADDGQPA